MDNNKFRNLRERLRDAGNALMQPPEMPDQDAMMADPMAAKDSMGAQGLVNTFNAFNAIQPDEPGIEIGENPLTGEPMYMNPAMGGITKFNKAPRLFKVGKETFPAEHAAKALRIQEALEKTGKVPKGLPLVPTGETADIGKVLSPESFRPKSINNINYPKTYKKITR